jgi:cytochrome c551/c552
MSERRPLRGLYLLTAGVLLLGTLLLAVGTRTARDDSAHASHAGQNSRAKEMCPPLASSPGLLERGATVQRMACAGCHSIDRREIGPSYAHIAERYRCRPDELPAAVRHPRPGWVDYPPGPAGPPLGLEDQAAVVSWILNAGGRGDE